MVAIDANVLMMLLDRKAKPSVEPATGKPVSNYRERVEILLENLENDKRTLIIPAPALAEVLIKVDNVDECIAALSGKRFVRIEPFDVMAAKVFAKLMREKIERTGKMTDLNSPRVKAKFDAQIIAIAKANGIKIIYSDDLGMLQNAKLANISVHQVKDLPDTRQIQPSFKLSLV